MPTTILFTETAIAVNRARNLQAQYPRQVLPESWGDRTTPLEKPQPRAPQPPRSLWELLEDEG